MTAIPAADAAWHYRLINASIAAMHVRRDPPDPETPAKKKPPALSPDAPGYHAVGLKAPPTCFLGGERDINAGFLGETSDNYVVLAFRGTLGGNDTSDSLAICLDWAQDRLYGLQPFTAMDGLVYGQTCEGFTAALTSIWSDVETALAKMSWVGKRGIWITGHSKGGAMAGVAATRVQHLYPQASHPTKVVTFGAPMVADGLFKVNYARSGLQANTVRYQNQHDPVPMAPSQKTPGMQNILPGCTAVYDEVAAVEGCEHLGELRYITRDLFGNYEIKVGDNFGGEYVLSLAALANNLALAGEAHNPNNNYLNCFRLADT